MPFHSLSLSLGAGLLLALQERASGPASAPAAGPAVAAAAAPAGVPAADPELAKILAEVSAERIRKTVHDLVAFGTRHTLSRTDSETEGIGAARSYLEKEMQAVASELGGRMVVERKPYRVPARRTGGEVEVVDIVATLRGESDPDRIYLIGGHYDSRNSDTRNAKDLAPGADDDASGTAVALELCRVLGKRRFPATLVFVAFDAEELGLLGSTALAKELAAKGARVDGMITCDIVGNTLGVDGRRVRDYVRCFSYAARGNDTTGRQLARTMADATRRYVQDFRVKLVLRGDRYGRGGDHGPFMREGFPAVRLTEPLEDLSRQHRNVTERDGKPYGDLPAFVDFDYVANVARSVGACLGSLASAPPAPGQVKAAGRRDAYDTDLEVTAVEGGVPLWGFEVVWRDTAAPDWEGSRLYPLAGKPGQPQKLRLPGVLLDDHVVGVRAVSARGHRSRVTTPPEPDALEQR